MKQKAKSSRIDELRREYRRSDFPEDFIRGKYAVPSRTDVSQEIYATGISAGSGSDDIRGDLRLLKEREQQIGALSQALIEGEDSGDTRELDSHKIRCEARCRRKSGD